MSILAIPSASRQIALGLLQSLPPEVVETVLSSEGVYLGFQSELIRLDTESRRRRTAELTLHLLGTSLLKNNGLRVELCGPRNIDAPSRWRPGSASAFQVCEKLGLPPVFAGAQPPPSSPTVESLSSPLSLPPLTDFQNEVYSRGLDILREDGRAIISLPTGGGKTRVAVELLRQWHADHGDRNTSLWIAHTVELCEQAAMCITQRWQSAPSPQPAAIFRAWGNNTRRICQGQIFDACRISSQDSPQHTIIISTPQGALTLLDAEKAGSLSTALDSLSLVVIDEAHRAASPSYRSVINRTSTRQKRTAVLGLSATPVRETYASNRFAGTQQLVDLFQHLIEPTDTLGADSSPVLALQKRGVLATLRVKRIDASETSISDLAQFIAKQRHSATGQPALAFSSTTSQSKVLSTYLNDNKITSAYVTAASSAAERTSLTSALRRHELDILCNCELLTTGFDAPAVNSLFMARHTNSPVLYKQIIGRGLRGPAFGGSKSCTLYLCGIDLPFPTDPQSPEFARKLWSQLE